MRLSFRLAATWAALTFLCSNLGAGEPMAWETNLERAEQTAAQTNRLVMVHFWAPWCGYCKRMDAQVFVQPEVAKQIQANYVPVKLDADQNPELAKKFGITGLPADVILTPQGQVVNVALGNVNAEQYVARLNQVSATVRQQNSRLLAAIPAGAPAANAIPPTGPGLVNPSQPIVNPTQPNELPLSLNGPANGVTTPPFANNVPPPANANINNAIATLTQNPPATPGMVPLSAPPANLSPNAPPTNVLPTTPPANYPPNNPPANVLPPNTPPANTLANNTNNPPAVGQPANVPPRKALQLPPGSPPLALDGYCPVTLVEKKKWVLGDTRYGANHLDRTYLFAGPEEQRKFLANSNFDRYAPVAKGIDVVLAAEEHKVVPGKREHGVFFKDHIFLFASEASVQKFYANPFYYMGQALGTPMQAAANGQQSR